MELEQGRTDDLLAGLVRSEDEHVILSSVPSHGSKYSAVSLNEEN